MIPLRAVLTAVWLLVAGSVTAGGWRYYALPPVERAYSSLHDLFAPTGVVGHSLGYLGTLMVVVGVLMYIARKRLELLQRAGRLSTWLQVHIFLCTLGPYLVLLHTSFKFRGVAAVSFWSMAVAVGSGVVGRYIYVRIPRAVHGRQREIAGIEEGRAQLASRLHRFHGIDPDFLAQAIAAPRPQPGLTRAVALSLTGGVHERLALWRLGTRLRRGNVGRRERRALAALARAQMRAELEVALLAPFQRLFRYWHILHVPVAVVMFTALAVHVLIAILFGYGWPF